eukprot:7051724-Lingulodinium_polyedra.AAC.1
MRPPSSRPRMLPQIFVSSASTLSRYSRACFTSSQVPSILAPRSALVMLRHAASRSPAAPL